MTAKEAYIKMTKRVPGRITACHEYDTLFVFQIVPPALILSKSTGIPMDSLMCVEKSTGAIKTFKPFDIPSDEYRRGKKLNESEYKG